MAIKSIYFDMDGTIADFYNVNGWLNSLERYETKPYRVAKPLVNMRELAREIKRVQNIGYKVGIISWLSKTGTEDFNARVTKTKKEWLKKHLGSVTFDTIHIVKYGTPKYTLGEGILFDDETKNRKDWEKGNYSNFAFSPEHILTILKNIC